MVNVGDFLNHIADHPARGIARDRHPDLPRRAHSCRRSIAFGLHRLHACALRVVQLRPSHRSRFAAIYEIDLAHTRSLEVLFHTLASRRLYALHHFCVTSDET